MKVRVRIEKGWRMPERKTAGTAGEAEFERRGTQLDSCRTPHAVRIKHLPRRDRRSFVEVDRDGNTIMHGRVKRREGLMLWHKRIGGQK